MTDGDSRLQELSERVKQFAALAAGGPLRMEHLGRQWDQADTSILIHDLLREAELWKSRWEAERRDHEATIKHCDKMLNEGP